MSAQPRKRHIHTARHTTQRLRTAFLARTQPAVLILPFAANHLVALGLAREEIEMATKPKPTRKRPLSQTVYQPIDRCECVRCVAARTATSSGL